MERLLTIIGVGSLTIWGLSVCAAIVSSFVGGSYETPPEIHAIMMTVSGGAFGWKAYSLTRNNGRGDQ